MELVADWIMPYQGLLDARLGRSRDCRVRIYRDYAESEPQPVILMSDMSGANAECLRYRIECMTSTVLGLLAGMCGSEASCGPLIVYHRPLGAGDDSYQIVCLPSPQTPVAAGDQYIPGANSQTTSIRSVSPTTVRILTEGLPECRSVIAGQ